MMSKRKRYQGLLAKPIKMPRVPLKFVGAVTPKRGEEYARAVDEQRKEFEGSFRDALAIRVELLFQHFGVPLGDWRKLTLELAKRHVPAFSPRLKKGDGPKEKKPSPAAVALVDDISPIRRDVRRVGPPPQWDIGRLLWLVTRVDDIKRHYSITDKEALQRLITDKEFSGWTVPTLKSRLYEGRALMGEIERLAR
jgi:hypothetical protein